MLLKSLLVVNSWFSTSFDLVAAAASDIISSIDGIAYFIDVLSWSCREGDIISISVYIGLISNWDASYCWRTLDVCLRWDDCTVYWAIANGESAGICYRSTFLGDKGKLGRCGGLPAVDCRSIEMVWSAAFCRRFAVWGVHIWVELAGS